MGIRVTVNSFESPDAMHLESETFECVQRQCMIGAEDNPILLVKNGELEISYSPKFDHYWFSRCPNQAWFSKYYASEWNNQKAASPLGRAKKAAKDILRPVYHPLRRLVRGKSEIENYISWDIDYYFSVLRQYATRKDSRILDVGCGQGEFLAPYLRQGFYCSGIEPSEKSAGVARRRGIDVLVSDVVDSPEIQNKFSEADIVFSNHSLEHHWDPKIFLSLAQKAMKPGAVLSITVPNGATNFWFMQNLYLLHLDAYTPHSLEALLARYGFRCFFKGISSQLRYVAVRDPRASQIDPIRKFDEGAFQTGFQALYARQVGVDSGQIGDGKDFSFSFKGARPFVEMDYDVRVPADTKLRMRTVRGFLATDSQHGPLVRYNNSNNRSYVLLK